MFKVMYVTPLCTWMQKTNYLAAIPEYTSAGCSPPTRLTAAAPNLKKKNLNMNRQKTLQQNDDKT